jgi:hypothetical protein
MVKKIITLWYIFILFISNLMAQGVTYTGTSVANFLKIGYSAKSVSMAESNLSLSEDASTLYLNPGVISWLEKSSVSFSYINWLVDTKISYLSLAIPFDFGTMGFDLAYFSSGDILETTILKQEGTGRVVSASDLSLGLSYAKNFTDRFSVGLKVKYLRESLVSVSASTFALDIGSVFKTSILNDMKIGIALSNFGGTMQFTGNELITTQTVPFSPTNKQIPAVFQTESWDLPLMIKLGISTNAIETKNYKLSLGYTLVDSRDYTMRSNLGASLKIFDVFELNGGYRFNYDEVSYSLGVGVKANTNFAGDILLNYAFTNFGRLGLINQFSLSISF